MKADVIFVNSFVNSFEAQFPAVLFSPGFDVQRDSNDNHREKVRIRW